MAEIFRLKVRLPRNFQGSLTCRKSATWDRRLYFPSEGRRAEDFFARKIRRLWLGLNPRSEASTLTTRPPKPLSRCLYHCCSSSIQKIFTNNEKQFHYRPGKSWEFQEVEAPRYQDNWQMKVASLSSPRSGRFYPRPHNEIFLVLISVRG